MEGLTAKDVCNKYKVVLVEFNQLSLKIVQPYFDVLIREFYN